MSEHKYACFLCHDSGWICDGNRPGTVAILTEAPLTPRAVPPTEKFIEETRAAGLQPRRCDRCPLEQLMTMTREVLTIDDQAGLANVFDLTPPDELRQKLAAALKPFTIRPERKKTS